MGSRSVPSLPPPLAWATPQPRCAGLDEKHAEERVRRRLRGLEPGTVSAEPVARMLRRAAARLQENIQGLATAWGPEPLLRFDATAATLAAERGAQVWAIAAAREGARLAEEARLLADRAALYESQLSIALREARMVARVPLLWLLDRLEHVARQAKEHRPRLQAARQVLVQAVVAWGRGDAANPVGEHQDVWPDLEVAPDAVNLPPVILEPAAHRRLRSRWSNLTLEALEMVVDLAATSATALGWTSPPSRWLAGGQHRLGGGDAARATSTSSSSDATCGRPSLWLAPLEVSADGASRLLHEFGHCTHLPGLFSRPRLTTGYWRIRGIGAPIRMMCSYAGVLCEDIKYELRQRDKDKGVWHAPEWEEGHKPDLRRRNSFIELPYVVNHRSGEVASLSNSVALYLSGLLGLGGITRSMRLLDEQLVFYLHGAWMELIALVYPTKHEGAIGEVPFPDRVDAYLGRVIPPLYQTLEALLRRRGTGFFVGWLPRTTDFHAWELLDQHEVVAKAHGCPAPLDSFEALKAFHCRFRALPRLQRYFESEDARLPINNKTALFK